MRFHRLVLFSTVTASAIAIAACSTNGNNNGVSPVIPTATPTVTPTIAPVLAAGKVTKYSGTDVTSFVYANPGPHQANYTAGYSFAQVGTVSAAPAGAPAPFDLNVATTYTTTQVPTTGNQHISQTIDNYESQTLSGASYTVALVGSKAVTVDTDLAAVAGGGGPYTATSTITTTYVTPRLVGVYPLVAGNVTTANLARNVATSTTDVSAGGTQPTGAFPLSVAQSFANDGSTTRTQQLSDGEQDVFTETPSGTASENETGPLYLLQTTIGLPVLAAAGYTIPNTWARQDVQSGPTAPPTFKPRSQNAADWYPGAALPPQPLALDTLTVKGPATTLPAGCSGAVLEPNIVEVDAAQTSLNVNGTYEKQTQQQFDSNGTLVCVLRTTTTSSYNNNTGVLLVTATEAYAQILTSLTGASSAVRNTSILRAH